MTTRTAKHLNPVVPRVTDDDVSLGIHTDTCGAVEIAVQPAVLADDQRRTEELFDLPECLERYSEDILVEDRSNEIILDGSCGKVWVVFDAGELV